MEIQELKALDSYLSRLIVGPGEMLKNYLSKLLHIGPLREIPSRAYAPDKTPGIKKWWKGLAAWDLLYNGDSQLTQHVNYWLERLNTGYEFENVIDFINSGEYKAESSGDNSDSTLKSDELGKALRRLARRMGSHNLLCLRDKDDTALKPEDVGVGISQIIPIIVAAIGFMSKTTLIEQPEIHLHPALQAELGDLFIGAALGGYKNQFIIETHSEHLLLRLMRRMRETAEERIEEGKDKAKAKPDDIMVAYIEPTDQSSIIREMPLNELGELVKAWPGGFFEEGLKEVF